MTGVEMLNALGYVEDKRQTNQFIDESHGDGDYAFVRFISTFKDVEIGYYDGYGGKGETTFRASGELLLACIQYMKDNGWIK